MSQPEKKSMLDELYATLGSAQAGLAEREKEAAADMVKLNAQRAKVAKKHASTDDPEEQAQLEQQLAEFDEIETVLRKTLGPTERPTSDVARQPE